MTIDELRFSLKNLKHKLNGTIEVTVDERPITGGTISTNMKTGAIVIDLHVDQRKRLDLEEHPAYHWAIKD